ncbi:MAG: DNA polymerase III subunit gamma/tau [Desulfobulbus sp.]|nr:DNA polymerase III subunit gamma/tau [Desulfobulbus sp.]
MSYLVLARKSRPQTFAEIVGQKPIVQTLQNALAQNRVPHALIFSGIRGTGKTTLARIMAKALNCEQGPAVEPCNICRSCREITDGTSLDLQEVDGASNRGIQEIRELKEKIRFLPTHSRFKIILIDEVHMLTAEAFNALLKTLEEPPAHVYFMFATTELHKIPVTILSRCQRYELKRLTHQELTAHFQRLAALEGIEIEPEALDMVARESGGSVRDGLSLLDQIFSYCGKQVQARDVIEMLGLVAHELVAQLGTALLQGDLAGVYRHLNTLYRHGSDLRRFTNDLLTWLRSLIVCKISQDPSQLLEVTDDEITRLSETAVNYSLPTLSALFDLLLEGLEKITRSQQPRLTLELAFIRAVQFHDVVPVSELMAQLDRMTAGIVPESGVHSAPFPSFTPRKEETVPAPGSGHQGPGGKDPSIARETTVVGKEKEIIRPAPPSQIDQNVRITDAAGKTAPVPAQTSRSSTLTARGPDDDRSDKDISSQSVSAPPAAETKSTPPSAAAKKRIRQHWGAFVRYVHGRQPWIAAALQMAKSVDQEGEVLTIHFDDSIGCTLLKQPKNIEALTASVLDFFQENLRIQFEVPGSTACALDPGHNPAPLQERRALANDPLVLTALEVFTGQVEEIRVGERYQTNKAEPADPIDSEEQPDNDD